MLTQVAEGVLVHQSELLQNNTAVVQGTGGVLLIDAGITGDEMACLANDLREMGQPVVAGFSTHPDWDHVLWHDELGDVPRHGTARCAADMQDLRSNADWKARVAEGLPEEIAEDIPLDPFGLITGLPAGTAQLPWDGPQVRVIEHPAHSPGHAALLIEESGVLAAGDMLSDVFIPMLDNFTSTNDPIEEYLVGLQVLEGVADDVAVVIPGHGSVGEGVRSALGSNRTARTCMPCVTAMLPATRGSTRPSPAGNGSATSTPGKPRAPPRETSVDPTEPGYTPSWMLAPGIASSSFLV